MKRSPLLSLVAPGLGQMYGGDHPRGAAILFGAIVIANLNILILPLIALANPGYQLAPPDEVTLWAYWIPRIVHDVSAAWSLAFWLWAVFDAYLLTHRAGRASRGAS